MTEGICFLNKQNLKYGVLLFTLSILGFQMFVLKWLLEHPYCYQSFNITRATTPGIQADIDPVSTVQLNNIKLFALCFSEIKWIKYKPVVCHCPLFALGNGQGQVGQGITQGQDRPRKL